MHLPMVNLFLTRRCNLRCGYCNLYNGDISWDIPISDWITVLDKLGPHTDFFAILGGEPTLYKDLPKIIDYMNSTGYNYSMVTNGTADFNLYRDLVQNNKIKSISVSIDPSFHIKNTEDSKIKSANCVSLVVYLRDELDYNGEIVICSTVGDDIEDFKGLNLFAWDYSCVIAMPLIQQHQSTDMMSSNTRCAIPDKEKTLAVLKYIVEEYDKLELADPVEYFQVAAFHLIEGTPWKCKYGLTPAVDCNGDLWACIDYKGNIDINLVKDDYDIEAFARIQKEVLKCSGCTWNCPIVNSLIADHWIDSVHYF